MKAIIFDLDGVICFTDKYHYLAWKTMADSIGVYFNEIINNRLRGVSRMDSLDIILEKSDRVYGQEEKEKLAEMKNAEYVKLLRQMSPKDLSTEVKETLDELRSRGYLLAIGSSSKNTKMILGQLGLDGYFDAISDGTNITNSKPDPEVFLKAAEYLGFPAKECLVVEDAVAGIEAAYRGGFESAGIGEACRHEQVTYKMDSFKKLLDILPKRTKIRQEELKRGGKNMRIVENPNMKLIKDKKLLVGADNSGSSLKNAVVAHLEKKGWEIEDIGAMSPDENNPDNMFHRVGLRVGAKIAEGEYERALVFCGTGMGIHIAASKCPHVHAAVVESVPAGRRAITGNNVNVLAMGAFYVSPQMGIEIAEAYLSNDFGSGYEWWDNFYEFHKLAVDEMEAFDYEAFKAGGFRQEHLYEVDLKDEMNRNPEFIA